MSKNLINDEDFQTVVSSENGVYTIRSLDPTAQENENVGEEYQVIDVPLTSLPNGCFDLENLPKFTTLQELLDNLCEVMIRFDTSPKNLLKSDYEQLVKTLTNGLIYLYTSGGDMLKSVYDPDNDGIVTKAKSDALGNIINEVYLLIDNLDDTLGIDRSGGSISKFLNEKGEFVEVSASNWENDVTYQTYSDWYIPSKTELEVMYSVKDALIYTPIYDGEFLASSSENYVNSTYGYSTYWCLRSDGVFQQDLKHFIPRILPIRTFQKNEVSQSLYVGDYGEGGYIFYSENNGSVSTYLEVYNEVIIFENIPWSNINSQTTMPVPTVGTSVELLSGKTNTLAIINQTGHTISAAKLITEESLNIYKSTIKPKNNKKVSIKFLQEINQYGSQNLLLNQTGQYTDFGVVIPHVESKTNPHETSFSNLVGYPTTPEGKFLDDSGSFVNMVIGGNSASPVYYTPATSTIVGTYKQLSYIPHATEVETSYTLTTTESLLTTYIYDQVINITVIDAGNWYSNVIGKVSSSAGTTTLRLHFFVYKDGVKTYLFDKLTEEINNTDYGDIKGNFVGGTYTIDALSHLGVEIYGITTGASKTISFKVGGGNQSYIETPIKMRHDNLRDKNGNSNFLHITSTEKNNYETLVIPYAIDSALDNSVAGEKIADHFPFNCQIIDIVVNVVKDPPTGGKFYVDVKKNGTSIFSTNITVDDGETTSTTASVPYVLTTTPTQFLSTDKMSVEIVQAGLTNPGKNPIINFILKRI